MAAARRVTVNGVNYTLPAGLKKQKALETINMELPQGLGGQKIWIPVTRIETINWKHREVFSEFSKLRVRSSFAANGDLVWTENFGPEINGVVETIKDFITKKNYFLNELTNVKKTSAKAKVLKKKLTPINAKLKKFHKVLKTLT